MNQKEKNSDLVTKPPYEEDIAKLVEEIRGYRDRIEHLSNLMNLSRENLEELLIKRGSNWKDSEGYAILVNEGERTSYDTKALDELLMSDPLRYGWLHDYRRKNSINSSVKVK